MKAGEAARILTALLIGASGGSASANLRAPMRIPQAPSTALWRPADGITVLAERLRLDCEASGCRVEAQYDVEVASAQPVALEFVLPAQAQVSAELRPEGGAPVILPTTTEPLALDSLTEAERGRLHDVPSEGVEVARARFTAALPAGRSTLVMSYPQPLGSIEVGHSYFGDGELVAEAHYHLWPLKAWDLAPDFSLDLAVSWPREEPGLWDRMWGDYASIGCLGLEASTATAVQRRQVDGRLVYNTRLREATMPDLLTCRFGSAGTVEP